MNTLRSNNSPFYLSLISFLALAFFALSPACSAGTGENSDSGLSTAPVTGQDRGDLIQARGTLLVEPDGSPYTVRGVAFGNSVWSNPSSANGFTHHTMDDYAAAAAMGFNSVRFYINYGLFEDDSKPYAYKEAGFAWLDQNIAAAKKQGIRLLLNMHYPQGGYQSIGQGDALWNNPANQKRLGALWKEIARRYAGESGVLGFGILNEPVPVSGMKQWETLAQNLIDSIRSVNQRHLIFVERAIWLKNGTTAEIEQNLYFPQGLKDPSGQLVYEFHLYDPMPFSHQNASWTSYKGSYAVWPDHNRIEAKNKRWAGFTDSNPAAPVDRDGWIYLEGAVHYPANDRFKLGHPTVQARSLGRSGSVLVSDLEIEEFDPEGRSLGVVYRSAADSESGWYYWSEDSSGSFAKKAGGRTAKTALEISGSTGDANISDHGSPLKITQGNGYKASGWVKIKKADPSARVVVRLDYYSADSVHVWNKAYLESVFREYADYGKTRNVPLYIGEFGLMREAFAENRGGEIWIADILDILAEYSINYNYHTWHESAFGIYGNDRGYPDPAWANRVLIDAFTKAQTGN